MKIYSPLLLLGTLGVLSAAGTAAAQADTSAWKCSSCPYPKGTSATIEAGLGAVSDASAKFGDFTGLQRDGAHLLLSGAVRHSGDNGNFADLNANELGLGSRSLSAQAGREGLYTLRLGYSAIPRQLSEGAVTPFVGNGGASLSLPAGFPADPTTAMPLAATLKPVDLGFTMKRMDLGASWNAGENWTYRIQLRHDVRDGTRPQYGSFFSTAAQLAAPVDHVVDQLEASASYITRQWQATLAYHVSLFRNGQDSLTWANPFSPVVAGSTRGQLALAPDNQFHQIVGSAGYQITPTIRASADFAVGRMTQDEAFLAPTLTAGLAAALPALPASSLGGRVDTFNGSVKLSAAPIDGLRLNASYARDERDNRTASKSYPGLATDMFLEPQARLNRPFGQIQDRLKLNADYRASSQVKLSAGAEQDNRQRSYQEVVTTRETTVWGRIGTQPHEDVALALKLAYAERSHSAYGTAQWFDPPQNSLMRKYNLAKRQRDSAGLRADIALSEKLSLGLGADYANDDYSDSPIGLNHARSMNLSADLALALSEQTRVHLFAQGERIRSRQAGSQLFAAPDWRAENDDRFDVVGLGIRHAAIADKLDIGADVTVSRSRSNVSVDTVATLPLFPAAKTSQDSVKLYATYKLNANLWLTGSVWHETYDAQDWQLDGVMPATLSSVLTMGQQAPNYRLNVVRVSLRYKF